MSRTRNDEFPPGPWGRDLYAEARALAARLEAEGHPADARALIDAIEVGCTATEILMALRWNLARIVEAGRCSDETKREIAELRSAISAKLL